MGSSPLGERTQREESNLVDSDSVNRGCLSGVSVIHSFLSKESLSDCHQTRQGLVSIWKIPCCSFLSSEATVNVSQCSGHPDPSHCMEKDTGSLLVNEKNENDFM